MKVTRKLLIPTLIFITVMFLGFITINTLNTRADIEASEEQNLAEKLETFQDRLKSRESFAVGLALQVANNPEVQAAFAAGDRERLIELTLPSYLLIDEQFDIPQYQFHLPPATSFLRLHNLEQFDDDLSSFRFTVLAANAEQRPVSGPEIGRGGLGIRGVAPVSYENEHIGTVEFGLNIDQTLLNTLKDQMNADLQLMLLREPAEIATFAGATADVQGPTDDLILQASTLETPIFGEATIYPGILEGTPAISRISVDDLQYAIISAPVYDFSGKVIGVIEIFNDRTDVVANQRQNVVTAVVAAVIMITLGGVGLALIMTRMLSPIGKLTEAAAAISEGDLNRIVGVDTNDEIGLLATAFNNMTFQLKGFISSLEDRVAARTSDLNLAAEIGRQVSQVRDLHELLPQAVQLVLEQFGLYQTQIYLVNEADKWLVLEASTGHAGTQLLEAGHALPIDEKSLNGTAVVTKQAVLVADTAENPAFRPHPLLPDTRSEMVVPLVVGDKVVGVLDLQSDKPNALVEENLPAFETLAGQLAVAIQNAALLSERQRTEAKIRENESLMRTIIDSTPDWVFVKSLDHRYIVTNKEFANTLQMTPEEVVGKNDLEVGIPEEVVKGDPEKGIPGIWPSERKVMDSGEMETVEEETILATTGQHMVMTTTRVPLKDAEGNVSGFVGFIHDITERKQFERELEAAHARTQEILESITVPLVVSRISDGIVAYVNEPLAEVIRVPRDELIGKVTPDFYEDPAKRQGYLTALREQGKVSNYDLRLKRGDGDLFWALISGRVIDFEGAPAIITSVIDINDRREAEATVARRATELETVANVSAVAASILEPEELLQQAVELTKERFALYHTHLYLMDENRSRLVLSNGAGEIGRKMVTEGRQIALTQEQSLVARAARTHNAVVINNVQVEPGFLPHPLLPKTRSELAVPLIAGNEVLGVLDVQADEIDYFTPEEVNVFSTLASQIAVAVQNARRHDEAQRALDELTRLQRIMVREGWEDYLSTEERPFSGYAFNTKGAKPIEDTNKAAVVAKETANNVEDSTAETTIPIAVRGELIGKIALRTPDGSAIPERKQSLINTVANQVSEALERARLTAQTQRALSETAEQARRRAVLNQTSEQLNRAETMDEIFAIVAKSTQEIVPSDRVSLAVLNDKGDRFSIVSLAGDEENVPVGVDQPLSGSFIENVVKTGLILVAHDTQANPKTDIRSSMVVPLVAASGPIGTLNVSSKKANVYTDADQGVVLQLASILSSIIENKRLFTNAQERARELALINRVVARVSASLDIGQSLQVVADELAEAIGVDAIGIALINEDQASLTVAAEHYNPENAESSMGYVIPIEGNTLTQEVLNTRRTILVEDAQNNSLTAPVHDGMRMRGVNTLYVIPMFAGNEIIGTVGIDILEKERRLSAQQLRMAETIIFQAATAVQNARLFAKSEQRAAELSLLNAVSELASSRLELAALFDSVGHLLQDTFAAQSLYFALYDKKTEIITFPYFFSNNEGMMNLPPQPLAQGGYTGQIIKNKRSMLRILERHDPNKQAVAEGAQVVGSGRDTDCYLGTPMIVGNEVIGVMALNSFQETRTYTEQDQRVLETLADTIGVAVQNIRQFQVAQRQAEREALINSISQKIQSAPTIQSALQTAVSELGQALKLKKAVVELTTNQSDNGH